MLRNKMWIWSLLLALPLALSACSETMKGAGDDIEDMGDEVEDATD